MIERDLYPAILAACSRGSTRLFRSNAGVAYQGTVVEQSEGRLVLLYPRAIRLGCAGMSDLTGWTIVHDGTSGTWYATYTAIEVKSRTGRSTPEQKAFLDLVRRSGGRSGIARSVEDAQRIIRGQ